MNNKKVSVGIISYNHLTYLPTAIESVLNQTYQNIEIVIVDDGSKDGSLEFAENYARKFPNIKVFTHENHSNKGISATCNLAIEKSTGEYISILGSDDAFYSYTIEEQLKFLEENPACGMVCGVCQHIDQNGEKLPRIFGENVWADSDALKNMFIENPISAPTVMVRRACYDEVGLYDTDLIYSDYEMWLRIMVFSDWKIGFIDKFLAMYRVHTTNVSLNQPYFVNRQRMLDIFRKVENMLNTRKERHPSTRKWLKQGIAVSTLDMFYNKAGEGRVWQSLKYILKAAKLHPVLFLSVRRWASIFYRISRGLVNQGFSGKETSSDNL